MKMERPGSVSTEISAQRPQNFYRLTVFISPPSDFISAEAAQSAPAPAIASRGDAFELEEIAVEGRHGVESAARGDIGHRQALVRAVDDAARLADAVFVHIIIKCLPAAVDER